MDQEERATGRTTRAIIGYVDDVLRSNEPVEIKDHSDIPQMNSYVGDMVASVLDLLDVDHTYIKSSNTIQVHPISKETQHG